MLRKLLAGAALCAAFAAGSAVAAPVMYTQSTTVMNAKASGGFLGKVTVASPVTVLERKGAFARIRVSGWTPAEYPSELFSAPAVRIKLASIDEAGVVKIDQGKAKKSKTIEGNEWVSATAEGWIDAKVLTSDVNALWKKGRDRAAQACSSCHAAPHADHMTANQWAATLPVRGGRTGHTSKGQNELLLKTMQMHAKK